MSYKIAADIVVGIHLLWILFIILGALPGRRWLSVRLLHLGSIIFSLMLQSFGWIYPLTHLEVWLRHQQAKMLGYSSGFIAHYLERIIYLDVSPIDILIGTVVVILFSLFLYQPWRRSFFEK
ncbi:MAG: DUF2784 domain-containing protein [bacterium]